LATVVPLQDGVGVRYLLSFIKCVDDIVFELDPKMSGRSGENVYMAFLASRHGFVPELHHGEHLSKEMMIVFVSIVLNS
jgi:hypothetical protein